MFEFDNHYHHLMPNLPVELQSIIVKCLSDPDDFHSLARVSRDLNFLAVRELCSMYCLNLQKGMLTFDAKTFRVVPTLAISLYMFGASIEVLNCNLTDTQEQPELLKQTHSLRNFVSALSSVQRANFFFNNCGTVEWEDMIIAVCDVLVNRRCSDLQIKTLARSTAHPGRSNKLAMLIQKLSAPVAGKREVPCSVRQSNNLETCCLQTLPTFLQPILVLQLNASQLTTLTFCYIYNFSEWDDFMVNLDVPFLENFIISHCIIPGQAFSDFLSRHTRIVSLEYHHNTYLRHNPPVLPSGILPHLQRLHASSEYLVCYSPPLESFPELVTVVLSADDMVRDSKRAVMALQALLPCINDITLCLEFPYVQCLDNWLHENLLRSANANQYGEKDPIRSLSCVNSLTLDSKLVAYASDGVASLLVNWLCMFPALTRVFITRPCLPLVFTRDNFEAFAKSVQRGSASMRTISVQSEDFSVWTWCC